MATEVAGEVTEQLKIPSTATLTTVLMKHGLNNTFMHGVKPMGEGLSVAGPAFTLRYIPAREDLNAGEVDNLTDVQRVGIEQIEDGQVLVIDARGDTTAGTMGNILATRLKVRGCAGVVTDGAYRDTPAIVSIGMPAYAGAMNAHTNKTSHYPSQIQVPVACGGVSVFPGDIIVGDGEGVVVVPSHLAAEVAEQAVAQEELEDFLLQKITNGASIVGTYPPDEKTLAEFEVYKRGPG